LALPEPTMDEIFGQVYAEQTPPLVEQQQAYADYLATFADEPIPSGGRP
jgi:hypothetical protein